MAKSSGVLSSTTIDTAKEKFLNSFDESGKFILQSQDLVEVLKLGRKDLNKDEMSEEDFDALVHEMRKTLVGKEITLFDAYIQEAKEQYKVLLSQSLEKKDMADAEMITQIEQRKAEREKLRKSFGLGNEASESAEQLSETIDAAYLDELATQTSNTKHKEQLVNMKELLATNPNCAIKKERLQIQDGVLLVDGYTVPSDLMDHSKKPGYADRNKGYQKYDDMNVVGSEFLYAEGMLRLLNFFGEMGGKTFHQSNLNSTNLRDKSLDKKYILYQLRAGENNDILKDMSKVLNLQGYFPMGVDKDGFIIYASVRPNIVRFDCDDYRDDNDNYLASSNGNKTPLSGGVS